jgi:hypothetical protein
MKDEFPVVSRRHGDDQTPRPVQAITCGCGREDVLSAHSGRLTSAHVAGTFTSRGWLVGDAGKHVCPDCLAKRRAERRAAKEKPEMPKVERSPAATQKIGELYMILSEAYDAAGKVYKPGWSDQRIAKETGLAPEFVAKRREDDFGPVIVDASFDDLAAVQGALTAKIALARAATERQREQIAELEELAAKAGPLLKTILAKTLAKGV